MSNFFKKLQDGFKQATDLQVQRDMLAKTPLNNAVKSQNIRYIKELLDRGFSPNVYNARGETAFHQAIKTGSIEIAKLLLEYGAKPYLPVKGVSAFQNPIHLAIAANKPEMIALLKILGLSLNECAENGWTPLHHATVEGKTDIVRALCDAGADPCGQNADGRNAVLYAVMQNKPDIINVFLSYPETHKAFLPEFYKDFSGLESPLFMAVKRGFNEIAKSVISAGIGLNVCNDYGRSVLHCAVSEKNLDMLDFLLGHGADINKVVDRDGNTAFHLLMRLKKADDDDRFFDVAVERLMAFGADPNQQNIAGVTPFSYYVAQKNIKYDILIRMIDGGADLNTPMLQGGFSILKKFVIAGYEDTIEHILKKRYFDIDTPIDDFGNRMLHLATNYGHINLVRRLIECGAMTDIPNAEGVSAADMARKTGNVAISNLFRTPPASSVIPQKNSPPRPK